MPCENPQNSAISLATASMRSLKVSFPVVASPLGSVVGMKEMIDEGKMGFRAETKDGKKTGFMSYTEDEIAEINGGLNEYLIKMLYGK